MAKQLAKDMRMFDPISLHIYDVWYCCREIILPGRCSPRNFQGAGQSDFSNDYQSIVMN